MKALVPSLVISCGLYLGYNLKLGEYSSKGDIVEVKKPAKRLHYYLTEMSQKKSEREVSRFINDMGKQEIHGVFHKIQLDDPSLTQDATRYVFGIEENEDNAKKLEKLTDTLKMREIPEFQAVESQLDCSNRSQLFTALQMTFNVLPAIEAYVQKEKSKFDQIMPYYQLKSITMNSQQKFVRTAVSYPFGQGSDIFRQLSQKTEQKEENSSLNADKPKQTSSSLVAKQSA